MYTLEIEKQEIGLQHSKSPRVRIKKGGRRLDNWIPQGKPSWLRSEAMTHSSLFTVTECLNILPTLPTSTLSKAIVLGENDIMFALSSRTRGQLGSQLLHPQWRLLWPSGLPHSWLHSSWVIPTFHQNSPHLSYFTHPSNVWKSSPSPSSLSFFYLLYIMD